MKPLIIVNCKTYKQAGFSSILHFARAIAKVNRPKYSLYIAPPLLHTSEVARKAKIKVLAQHADSSEYGAHTGGIILSDLKQMGVRGAILNHSENKVDYVALKETVEKMKKKRMMSVVCASSLSEIKKVAVFHPSFIAYEPKELIGGDVSVTEASPNVIVKAKEAIDKISSHTKLLVGAGVHTREDVGHALMLGASGVLLAHAPMQAKDPKRFLENMLM